MSDEEIRRLRDIEKAAIELLPFLPAASDHHVPANNLRHALGMTTNNGSDRAAFLAALGNRVRAARLARRLSLEEVAQQTGLSKTGLWQIEKGKSDPGATTLAAIASVLCVSLDGLVMGK